ncbi:hypothetical protein L596_005464 [Steinernema carpocapsae]|uniref:Uncharacterized protein n=1 Tax=Steinernema carpocapsae TaxID=34508 RepID=A0A4U8V096_STECR|nr:hypothetical protein L596_005464 [Steinernema carpocapsae]
MRKSPVWLNPPNRGGGNHQRGLDFGDGDRRARIDHNYACALRRKHLVCGHGNFNLRLHLILGIQKKIKLPFPSSAGLSPICSCRRKTTLKERRWRTLSKPCCNF